MNDNDAKYYDRDGDISSMFAKADFDDLVYREDVGPPEDPFNVQTMSVLKEGALCGISYIKEVKIENISRGFWAKLFNKRKIQVELYCEGDIDFSLDKLNHNVLLGRDMHIIFNINSQVSKFVTLHKPKIELVSSKCDVSSGEFETIIKLTATDMNLSTMVMAEHEPEKCDKEG